MSEGALREIADSVAKKLSTRGLLPLGARFSDAETSETDGWFCSLDLEWVQFELFLDGWARGPTKQLYYGTFSKRRRVIDGVSRNFEDDSFTIGNTDEIEENSKIRLKTGDS